jgi:hypothetical protein
MPTALFLYVFSMKKDKSGAITLVSPYSQAPANPQRLAETGFIPSVTRRNVTFKASFKYNKGDLTNRDLKLIQRSLDKELQMTRIGKPYRAWVNALNAVPKLNENRLLRNALGVQVAKDPSEGLALYNELMTNGTIGGTAAAIDDTVMETTPAPAAQARVKEEAVANGDDPGMASQEASNLAWGGEGSFVVNDGEGDELADMLGGLMLQTRGGRRKKTHRRVRRRRHTRR